MNFAKQMLAAGLLATMFAAPLHAAFFNGTSADITDFENGSEVSTRGTLIDAINLINDDQGTPETVINGVLFKGVAPGQFHEAGETFAEASFVYHGGDGYQDNSLWNSGGAYEGVADSQLYGVDKGEINYGDGFGVVNLQPGIMYELQILMLDDRDFVDKNFPLQFQPVSFTGNVDEFFPQDPAPADLGYMEGITIGGAGVTQANGEIATIRFTIDEGYNGLFVNTWNNGAFNAMQLRSLGLPGDYNGDNAVDGADYTAWKTTFGSTTELAADGNGDGVVNAADYTLWRDHATSVPGGGSLGASAVPEPHACLLAFAALSFVARVMRRG